MTLFLVDFVVKNIKDYIILKVSYSHSIDSGFVKMSLYPR